MRLNSEIYSVKFRRNDIDTYYDFSITTEPYPPEIMLVTPTTLSNSILDNTRACLADTDGSEKDVIETMRELNNVAATYNALQQLTMRHADYVRKR